MKLTVTNILDKHEPVEYDVGGTQITFKLGVDRITISKQEDNKIRIASENGQLIVEPVANNCINAKTERW